MRNAITKIFALFKAKNIDLTPDETAALTDALLSDTAAAAAPAGNTGMPSIDPNIQHNIRVLEEMKASFEKTMKDTTDAFNTKLETLQSENEKLVTMLGEERTARENGMKVLEEKSKADREAKINEILQGMAADGRIPALNDDLKAHYKSLLEKDFDTATKIIEALPKSITPGVKPAAVTPSNAGAQGSSALPDKLGLIGQGVRRPILEAVFADVAKSDQGIAPATPKN